MKSYKMSNIKRQWCKKLASEKTCYYQTTISFSPNITLELRKFLYNKYEIYRKIYDYFYVDIDLNKFNKENKNNKQKEKK